MEHRDRDLRDDVDPERVRERTVKANGDDRGQRLRPAFERSTIECEQSSMRTVAQLERYSAWRTIRSP